MAAMNPGDISDLELTPGTDLNLDDDALFAELDSEVMAGGEAGTGDLDLDLGDVSGTGTGDDLDLDLGGGTAAGGGLDLDLDIGDVSGAAAGGDEMDLGDLGGESAGGLGDDLELDLGGPASEEAGDELDLDLGAGGTPETEDIDLDLGGGETASDTMDLDLGSGDGGAGEIDLDLGEEIGEPEAPADESMEFDLGGEGEIAAAGDEIDLGGLAGEEEADVGADMEALELDVGEADLEDLDLGAVDTGLVDTEPPPEAEPALEADLGTPELAVESMEFPEEPVFDMEAVPAAPAAELEPEPEFHAAEDIQLDEVPLQFDFEEPGMTTAPPMAAAEETIELIDESPLELEPEMIAAPAMEFEPVSQPAPVADTEFSAVQDMHVDDDTLLELNLDDVEQKAEEDESFMAQAQAHAASATEEAIPLTEQLEIPPIEAARGVMPASARAAAPAPAAAASMLNNEILMAVSHQISVQLGALSLNGKELLEIGYGSVLPLDRVIGEPVDLVLDNKTIAQAEVVLINGKNLGVRIVALNRH